MTKNELIDSVARKSHLPRNHTKEVIDNTFWMIERELRNGEKIVVSGFGTFAAVTRVARRGRNPKTGEDIILPEHRAVRFTVGKTAKRKLL